MMESARDKCTARLISNNFCKKSSLFTHKQDVEPRGCNGRLMRSLVPKYLGTLVIYNAAVVESQTLTVIWSFGRISQLLRLIIISQPSTAGRLALLSCQPLSHRHAG